MAEVRALPPRRLALVDVNNFYASCETVFQPHLRGRPVVVLSNNDGCVVARSPEAKALNITMTQPWHQVPTSVQRQVVVFSSNYTLYADMSARVMRILRDMAPRQEVYSIDESFLDLSGIRDLCAHGRAIRQRVQQWTGLTVCVGIGATKTRAKLANHLAKSQPGRQGVCDIEALSAGEEKAILQQMPVGEVWGVGRRIATRLQELGIGTVWELKTADAASLRRQFSVVLERTIAELNGDPCLDLETAGDPKQQICSSRSFGAPVTRFDDLRESVLTHASRAAEKLRAQGSAAAMVTVFVQTNRFALGIAQYANRQRVPLAVASDDTVTLARHAVSGLRSVFREGYQYNKAGVILERLTAADTILRDLFSCAPPAAAVSPVLDAINQRFGKDSLQLGRVGGARPWQMRRRGLSAPFTTDPAALPRVR